MLKTILRFTMLSLLAAAMVTVPTQVRAQEKEKPKTEKKEGDKKQTSGPFKGNLTSVDKQAKTITVKTRTFHITSETKIFKAGKPATLDEAVAGEEVSGGFKTVDGKMVLTKLNIGPKTEGKSETKTEKKKTEK